MILRTTHPIAVGTAAAAMFLAYGLLTGVGTPLLVAVGSIAFGVFIAFARFRVRAGQPAYSAAMSVGVGILLLVALGALVYFLGLPSGLEWIPLVLLFGLVLWVLRDAWRRRKSP